MSGKQREWSPICIEAVGVQHCVLWIGLIATGESSSDFSREGQEGTFSDSLQSASDKVTLTWDCKTERWEIPSEILCINLQFSTFVSFCVRLVSDLYTRHNVSQPKGLGPESPALQALTLLMLPWSQLRKERNGWNPSKVMLGHKIRFRDSSHSVYFEKCKHLAKILVHFLSLDHSWEGDALHCSGIEDFTKTCSDSIILDAKQNSNRYIQSQRDTHR